MSATDRLRAMLDERGVEWAYGDGTVRYESDGRWHLAWAYNDDKMVVCMGYLTPDQAIAATLGRERETELQKALNKAAGNWAKADAELCKALDFMRIWISEDAHLGESELGAAFEKAEGLRKLDVIESAIAVTLGGGKLTAEQVKDAWCANLKRDCLYDPPTPDWQAIADELNATLGAGTCKNKATSLRTFWCDCCDCALEDWMDVGGKLVNGLRYCPNCGRKVEG